MLPAIFDTTQISLTTPPVVDGQASMHVTPGEAQGTSSVSTAFDHTMSGLSDLFIAPLPPVLQQPPLFLPVLAPPKCARRPFGVTIVRRSARLAVKSRPIILAEGAQQHLCHKLGLPQDISSPLEIALKEYMATFDGPMPPDKI